MPWLTTWKEPEVAYNYKGVKVYHTYRHDDANDVISEYWFTLDPNSDENQFDVRDLPTWEGSTAELEQSRIMEALRKAIELGHLKKMEDS